MEKIKTDSIVLRKFGLILALGLAFISLIIFTKHNHPVAPTVVIASFFTLVSIFAPVLLKYLYIPWMRLAYVLVWINTRILLGIIFYLILSPVGLFLRLFRIDLLGKKTRPLDDSYWKPKLVEKILPGDYRRQS
jgi:hypothetical protein